MKKGNHVEFDASLVNGYPFNGKSIKLHGIVRHINNDNTATIQFLDPYERQRVKKDLPIQYLKLTE